MTSPYHFGINTGHQLRIEQPEVVAQGLQAIAETALQTGVSEQVPKRLCSLANLLGASLRRLKTSAAKATVFCC